MSDIGCRRRWRRFTHARSGKALIVPIDHGLTLGPIPGLANVEPMLRWLASGELTGVIMHKGMVERLDGACGVGLMVHLNGAIRTDDAVHALAPPLKVRLATVHAAVALGADAVSVHLDMGGNASSHCLGLLGEVVDEAHALGMPVLAMIYDRTPGAAERGLARQRHYMRAAVEVGADVLKVQAPADLAAIPQLIAGFAHTPVLFAGGEMKSDAELLALARAVVLHGASGLCVGRNVFQRGDPAACLREVSGILHEPAAVPARSRSVAVAEEMTS